MKANHAAKVSVKYWLCQYASLKEQTGNFAMNIFLDDTFRLGYREMTKDEIEFFMSMQTVDHGFLEFAPQILSISKPENRAEMRRNISYLAALQQKQHTAYKLFQEKSEREIEFLKETVNLLKDGNLEGRQNVQKYLKHLGHG